MVRLSRLTDYGIVLMAHLAERERRSDSSSPHNAREVAEETSLPLPVVSKILKSLARQGLLVSQRGAKGGYTLARIPEQISVAEMITAVDGPIALTECSSNAPSLCEIELTCPVRSNWATITASVRRALEDLTLEQMALPSLECNITHIGQPKAKKTLDLIHS